MEFNSYVFMLLFLPVLLIVNSLCVTKSKFLRNLILLLASLVFYGYGNPQFIILLGSNILFNYFIGILLRKENSGTTSIKRKSILTIGILVNIGVLLYYKYFNFFIDNFNYIFKTSIDVSEMIIPLGISFITFQQIAFLIDCYRKEILECNLLDYSLFISYFPHISSGPIVLHNDLLSPISRIKRKFDWNYFATGIYMFGMGMGKKVIIADLFAEAVNWGYLNIDKLNATSALFISVSYSIQIYFDFSGYSDMAVGISRMLQLDLPINFNSPYKAKTILEFWNRWHITLTRFLTKYLYIPLGGNRKGEVRTFINTLIVFLCSGLWHGASWTFILWGLLHGCFMILTKKFIGVINRIPMLVNQIITLLFINFTWILFRSGSLGVFRDMMTAITKNKWGFINEEICNFFIPVIFKDLHIPIIIWPIFALILVLVLIFGCKNVQESAKKLRIVSGIYVVVVVIISVLSFSGVSTFVYSNF